MKKTNQGFIVPILIIIIITLVVGGGLYINSQNKALKIMETDTQITTPFTQSQKTDTDSIPSTNPELLPVSNTPAAVPKKDLTDQQVIAALNSQMVAHDKSKYQYQTQQDSQGKITYGVSVDRGFNKIDAIYKGDLNNDGYVDALVWTASCGPDDECGHGFQIVINKKDGSGESIYSLTTPDAVAGWSGGKTTSLDAVKIEQGIVYITSSSFYSSGDWKTAIKLPKQTKKFQLQGNNLVEVK